MWKGELGAGRGPSWTRPAHGTLSVTVSRGWALRFLSYSKVIVGPQGLEFMPPSLRIRKAGLPEKTRQAHDITKYTATKLASSRKT